MLILVIIIAIVIGIIIARYYKPKSKSEKIWASILIPLVGGIIIHLLVASCRNSGYGFAFDLGATLVWIAIPAVALLTTLFIALKPEIKGSNTIESKEMDETFNVPLHYGKGDLRVDFEIQLTKQELFKMAQFRKKDPSKWEDNDLELVKEIKKTLQIEQEVTSESENDLGYEEVLPIKNSLESESVSITEPITSEQDNAKHSVLTETVKNQNTEEIEKKVYLFGNKLESEYRRESATDAHWIRQNGTEMCIKIDEVTYQQMIELQNENPKKWVDNEFNLFLEAKSSQQDVHRRKRKNRMNKWIR